MKQISINVSDETLKKLERYAAAHHWSRSKAAALLLAEALKKAGTKR